MIISFFARLCAPSEYVRVIVSPQCSLPGPSIQTFEESLRAEVQKRTKDLKFKVEKDATQGQSEITVVYTRGKDNRILKTIKGPQDLEQKTVEDIIYQLNRLDRPSMGCN